MVLVRIILISGGQCEDQGHNTWAVIFTEPSPEYATHKALCLPLLLASGSAHICRAGLCHQLAELLGYNPDAIWRDLNPSLNVQGSRECPSREMEIQLSKFVNLATPNVFLFLKANNIPS